MPLTLDLAVPTAVASPSVLAAPISPVQPDVAPVAPVVPVAPVSIAAPVEMPAVIDEPPAVRTAPPAPIVPVLGDVTSGPELLAPAPDVEALPDIREATPVALPSGPLLPTVPTQAPRPAAISHFEFDAASVAPPPTKQPRRRKKRSGVKLFATLVVLGGLVAAGVVFGQPYLFPSDWDDTTAPYAETVEVVRGVDFVEPLTISPEPSAEFAARLTAQLVALSPEEPSEWRALGLATGVVDDATLARQLTGWRDAVYSSADGQVYHDVGAAGTSLDAQLTQAMVAASLDQELAWSAEQPRRTLDAAAATSGEVLRQAREVQADSMFGQPDDPAPTALLEGLPAVVAYRLLAPQVFAEFPVDGRANPLAGLAMSGPAPLGDVPARLATAPVPVDGDTIVASPVAQDRSFWFLVFGGLLDAPTAYLASEAIVENSVTHAVRGSTECVYATFSGGGVDETTALRSALNTWAQVAPVEFASAVTVLPDGALQLSSCDPGPAFSAPLRTSAVAELISYRALELATSTAVAERGGSDPEFDFAWNLIAPSSMPADVAALPAGTPPDAIATAASDAVAAFYSLAG